MKTKYLYIVSALTLGLVGCSQEFQNAEVLINGPMSFNIVSPNATRVADGVFWKTAYVNATGDTDNTGTKWALADGTTAWYPVFGYLNVASSTFDGTWGYYWSASVDIDFSSSYAYAFELNRVANINFQRQSIRSYGYAVLCVRE